MWERTEFANEQKLPKFLIEIDISIISISYGFDNVLIVKGSSSI
jgi:hypothetical protein